jgi:23S rRNA pseudouridine1911/1915/1917 synthase
VKNFIVQADESGQTLAAVVRRRLGLSWARVKALIESHKPRIDRQPCGDPARRVRAGQRVEWAGRSQPRPARRRPAPPAIPAEPVPDGIVVRHVDDAVLVVEKPAGLTTMRHRSEAAEFGRGRKFLPKTLADYLPALVGDARPIIPVHRIDKETSGLVVFARTPDAREFFDDLFRRHAVEREYRAIVRGHPDARRIESWLIDDRGDGRRGSGPAGEGQRAVTYVQPLESLGPLSLVACKLETGRTHQIRIHLGEAGFPLAGERLYDRPVHGAPLPDPSGAKRIMLHAATLGFPHPLGGPALRFESRWPDDFRQLIDRFRG